MPALTLEAGKFYRAADNQKVGPLVPVGYLAFDGTGGALMEANIGDVTRLWRAKDGTHLFDEENIDLVAEWGQPEPDAFNPLDAVKIASLYASAKRLADAAERIATALEAIEKHLAPVITGTSSPVYDSLKARFERENGLAPDADGWTEWHGGQCPVPNGTNVDVRFRDRREWFNQQAWGYDARFDGQTNNTRAGSAYWTNNGMNADIVAYRLAK